MSTKQLYEKTSEGMKEVSPLVAIEDIYARLSDTPLEALVALYNHVKCEWKGSVADTRRTVPLFLRRSGLFITYNNGTKYITEFFSAGTDQITTEGWVKDSNWTSVPDEDYISAGVKPGVGTIGYEQLNDNLKQLFREKVNVTNFPDDEDIASVDNMLKLKDREVDAANFQSKGYVILRKNLRLVNGVVKNILTQDMINQPNTIYEIRYDFDLNGETINVPENCILKFEGGSLCNGDVIGNNTKINSTIYNIIKNVQLKHKWLVKCIYPQWFGAIGDGKTNNTKAIQDAIDFQLELANVYTISNTYTGASTYTTSIPYIYFIQGVYIVDKLNIYTYIKLNGNNALIKSNADDFVFGSVDRLYTNLAGWRGDIRNLSFSCKKAFMLNSRTATSNLDQGFIKIDNCRFLGVDYICDVDLQSVIFVMSNNILSRFKNINIRTCDKFILTNNFLYSKANSINDYESFIELNSAQTIIEKNLFVPSPQDNKKEIAWIGASNNRYTIVDKNRFGGEPGSHTIINCKGDNPYKYGYGSDSNLIIQNNQIYSVKYFAKSCIIRIFDDFIRNINIIGNTGCIDTSYVLLPSDTFDYKSKFKELINKGYIANIKYNIDSNYFDFGNENNISNEEISMIFNSKFGKYIRSKKLEAFIDIKEGKSILVIPVRLLKMYYNHTSNNIACLKFTCSIIRNNITQNISNYIRIYNYYNSSSGKQTLNIDFTDNIFSTLETNGVSVKNVFMKFNNEDWTKEHNIEDNTSILSMIGIEFSTDANNIYEFSIIQLTNNNNNIYL